MRLLWIALLAAVAAILVVMFLVHDRPPLGKRDVTLETLRRCDWIQTRFSSIAGRSLSSYLRTQESAGISLGQTFFAMISQPQNLPTISIELTTPVLKDAWGNALNLVWSDSSDAIKLPMGLRSKGLVVLIWSSGPNGSNEFGSGDDLYCSVKNAE